jgi:hypothetical protein
MAKNASAELLEEHPELREKMTQSASFRQMKQSKALAIDDEQLYVVQGDMLGDEADLYVDSIIRGSNPLTDDEIARSLFLELDESQRQLIMNRFRKT